MNVRLLRKVKKHILEEPRRFQMADVIYYGDPGELYEDFEVEYRIPSCGTVACIAGWSNLLSGENSASLCNAERLLGITGDEGERLFIASNWPAEFKTKWHRAKTMRTRTKIAAARIEFFIQTKGTDEPTINAINGKPNAKNTSGFRNVTFRKDIGKWQAGMCRNYKFINLGQFATPELAALAVQQFSTKGAE